MPATAIASTRLTATTLGRKSADAYVASTSSQSHKRRPVVLVELHDVEHAETSAVPDGSPWPIARGPRKPNAVLRAEPLGRGLLVGEFFGDAAVVHDKR